ncbi:uncharacterized protein BXZ73DRAFT_21839, partial [Epithele typhae]|uniref:uncharacterized protein n=1 Tax=Epithele typhae TaxID=378194 RepID=UPI002007A56E
PSWRLLAYAIPMFLLATAGLCLQTWLTHRAFIGNRGFSEGPVAFMISDAKYPGNLAVTSIYVVLNWFSDGMLLWRFHCIFKTYTGVRCICGGMFLGLVVTGSVFMPSISQLNINIWTNTSASASLAYLALSLSINVLLTVFMVVRLWWHYQHTPPELITGRFTSLFSSILWMFIEGASVYSVVAFIGIIALATKSPIQIALLPTLGQLQAIPSIMITVRITEF